MSLVRLEKVTKIYAGKSVLDEVDFRVEAGEKIGLIGRNGTGKSTIFRLITGDTEPTSGFVERMRSARVAHLAQLPAVGAKETLIGVVEGQFQDLIRMESELRTLEQAMTDGDPKALGVYSELQDRFTALGGYEFHLNVRRVLTGLGFKEEEFKLVFGALSGGQRTRLMLALVLLQDGDLLLLDEPENHLDLQAREWLETFLCNYEKAFVVISHDRQLLNTVIARTVEIERGKLRGFSGNYDAYLREKSVLQENHEKAYRKQQEFIERENRWINRFRYKNTKARQVQSRIKRLEKMDRVDAPDRESAQADLSLGDVVRSGQHVLQARGLSMAYGDLRLYDDVSFDVERGERVGIIGPNGSGKTTLLRHLVGRLAEGRGEVTLGNKVRTGFYDQHHDDLNPANTVLAELKGMRPDMTEEKLRTYLGKFLFRGEDVFKSVASISGGERSRVSVAKLVLSGANLLLLDEPTNHLDIASREAMEAALQNFPGTVIMVSHDRVLIDRMVGKLIIVEEGRAEFHLGNYSHYKWKLGEDGRAKEEPIAEKALSIRKDSQKEREAKKADDRRLRKQRRRYANLETSIQEREARLSQFEEEFAQADPSDYERVANLTSEYETMKRGLDEMYAEWEKLSDIVSH